MSKAELTEISMWKFFGATSNQVITLLFTILIEKVRLSSTFNWKRYLFQMISQNTEPVL